MKVEDEGIVETKVEAISIDLSNFMQKDINYYRWWR